MLKATSRYRKKPAGMMLARTRIILDFGLIAVQGVDFLGRSIEVRSIIFSMAAPL
jgi:hypothetical protein